MSDIQSKLPLAKDVKFEALSVDMVQIFAGTTSVLKPGSQKSTSQEALTSLGKAMKLGAFNNDEEPDR